MGIWNEMFGKDKEVVPPAVAPVGPAPLPTPAAPLGPSHLATFAMGVNIEEIYMIFGEQIQTQMGALPHNLYASAERKLKSVNETISNLGLPQELSAALKPIKARLERGMSARPQSSAEIAEATQASLKTSKEIGQLMGAIRKNLDDLPGLQYDLGIFMARLSLCSRMVRGSASLERGSAVELLYANEMRRAGGQFTRILTEGIKAGLFAQAFPEGLDFELADVVKDVARDESYSPAGAAGVEKRIESILAKAGLSVVRADL